MHITLVAGARPNFMKIAPIIRAIQMAQANGSNIQYALVHTGQHFDEQMSGLFFKQLNIPEPDVNLGCGGGTQAEQTAAIMIAFEKYLMQHKTDVVLVVGDVTSTMACTIVAKKLHLKVAHVEAGIRSGDMTMPEEINRIVTDSICDFYFTTSEWAGQNLLKQGADSSKIVFVGNTMIDTLLYNIHRLVEPEIYKTQQLLPCQYFVLTLHRPANVDDFNKLNSLLQTIDEHVANHKVIFPVHPRTEKILSQHQTKYTNIITCSPMGYLEFIYLVKHAKAVITDSGGITEEATVLGIPCLTLRNTTERPETCTIGTNELIGDDKKKLIAAINKVNNNDWKKGSIPEKWDGKAAERIVEYLLTTAS